jgi:glutamate dehydrogenase (NAD(P)+)
MESWAFPTGDEWGPEQVVYLSDPSAGLRSVVVVDNTAAGPAIGGVRMAPDVTPTEVFRLARAMTFKNAAAGLRHGGAKAGIVADPAMDPAAKARLVRAFGAAMRPIVGYIPGPDMGLDETMMAHLRDETGRAVGLPPVLGGIPLDVLGATGFGLAVAAEVAHDLGIVPLEGARVVVQGFGAVGRHAARFLTERGAVLVAASDSRGAVVDPDGLDLATLTALKADGRGVADSPARSADPEELIGLECDIWVPAARPDVFTAANAGEVRARLVLQGANIPATAEAEAHFHRRGVVSIPDFIANAGGVICAAVEYAGGTVGQAFQTIEEKIRVNTREVLERSRASGVEPREEAEAMAKERVREAMGYRRRF